ncbi:putative transcription repressor NiaR [bioreactor metagenome]|uniref:Putative transcription repressor NiaR n=1 Tax=bioreactor metagenome TaxID=1076179 RepID=A0A645HS72_9ZZZZ
MSTSNGYLLQGAKKSQREFFVVHQDDRILDELYTIVDLGGRILNVQVRHQVYGNFSAQINVKSRKDAKKLADDIAAGNCAPLKNLTQDEHFHLVEADSTEDLDLIEKELRHKGYLKE